MRKKADGTYSPFQTDEDEASYIKWSKQNKKRIDVMENSTREYLIFRLCMTEWEYERVNDAWNDALKLLGSFKKIIEMKEGAIKIERLSVALEHFDAINEHRSRKIGGDNRAIQLIAEKDRKHLAIQDKEKELTPTVKPHRLNVKIAEALNFPYDYVRKVRAINKKKRLTAS